MASRLPRHEAALNDIARPAATGFLRMGRRPQSAHGDREPLVAAELVGTVRARLGLDSAIPDREIEACIGAIMQRSDARGRWLAAFSSDLGRSLIAAGRDLNTMLRVLIALAPRARS
ncbi:MAG TPA: hypothetical protein PK264_14145 [Hyphomicrobiaceae bacterium]|nr:hypothetical protein [Hyphomicrobiaceae bacterium]